MLPMKELKESTSFHLHLVEQMYKTQRELIDGVAVDSHTNQIHQPNAALDLSKGLRPLIQQLTLDNEQLAQRMQQMETKYVQLRELTETMLCLVYARPRKVRFVLLFVVCYIQLFIFSHLFTLSSFLYQKWWGK